MRRRYKKICSASKVLAEEAFKAYTGKKDYKRAIEIYCLLSESVCVPKDISNFSKNMLGRLSKQIEEKS